MAPERSNTPGFPAPAAAALLLAATAVGFLAGCRERIGGPPPAARAKDADPVAVLRGMVQSYQRATTYADEGILRLRYREQGRFVVDETPLRLRFGRPNRLRLRAYNVTAVSDGERLFARIEDRATADLGGQVLVRRAPKTLGLADLYRDSVLRDALVNGLGRQPTSLELLCADEPLQAVFAPAVGKRLLPPGEIEGHRCLRVEAATPEGAFVFWIDEDELLLRKLEYPLAGMLPELAASAAAGDAELVAEFSNARFNVPLDDRSFVFPMPSSARQVRGFVLPPQPLPSNLFGKQPADFSLAQAVPTRLTRDALRGKIVAFVWFHEHPACRDTLEQFSRVHRSLSGDERLAFFAVSTEPANRSHLDIENLLKTWNAEIPLLRDTDACGRDVFQISAMPALIILDASGTVQIVEAGANSYLAEQLPVVLDRLLRGDNIAAEILAQQRREEDAYARAVERAEQADLDSVPDMSALAPRSEPARLRVDRIWECGALAEPGNILVLQDAELPPRILVIDGREGVAELNTDGALVARRKLAAPESPLEYLRSTVDGRGDRFYAGAALHGPTVQVFDRRWQRIGSYPPTDYRHSGVADSQLADLDGDGELELLVGFRGTSGIHAASLRGTRRWVSHALPTVLSLLPATRGLEESSSLLATGARGDILGLDASGQRPRTVTSDERGVFHLYSGHFPDDRPTAYCGITFGESGQLVALGLDHQLRKSWEHPLAAGSYRSPIQFVASGMWQPAGSGIWVFAGPDGTLHFVRDNGQLLDQFSLGTQPRGLALFQGQGALHLLVATENLVQCWRLHMD